ncbi:MAG: endonuclease/exonuclease/phosphatase family protein [Bacteroidota bacterium]
MKRVKLLLILCMLGMGYSSFSVAQENAFRVMTFNIRYGDADDGENRWDNRKSIVRDVIRYHEPGIIGMQEALHHQIAYVDSVLSDYEWFGVGRSNGKQEGEFSPVFYDTTRFELLKESTFWLSETPQKAGSEGWDAAFPRIVTWGYFYDRISQKSFYVLNTHFDHQGTIARLNSAKLLIQKISDLTENKSWIPVVLTGDFNSLKKSGPYQHLTHWNNPVKLTDTQAVDGVLSLGPDYSFNGFDREKREEMIIDYIFVNEGLNVHKHHIINDEKSGRYPSDHFPVITEISFKK